MKFDRHICARLLCAFALSLCPTGAFAADHLDGEVASADPAADITDVYAWAQDTNRLNLVLDVFPLANSASRFSDSVQYVFRVDSVAKYGELPRLDNEAPADGFAPNVSDSRANDLVCTFSVSQRVTCTLNGRTLVSDVNASNPAGVTSQDGSFRIFTGLRNDPFFFDLGNFNTVRGTVRDAVPSLTFDEAGCPRLDEATKSVLVSTLVGGGGLPGANNPPQDFFGSLNVLAIVIQADKSLFGQGPLYSVSASTHRAQ
jgi:hypothetical protein